MSEIRPPYVDENIEDLDKFYEEVLKDDTIKDTYFEYCYSILGYLANSQHFNFPIWLLTPR